MTVDKKRILITGISGLLGNNLAYCLKDKYDILGLFNSHPCVITGVKIQRANLTCGDTVGEIVKSFKPEVIVHCAALSDIDYCEGNQGSAYDINVLGTKQLVDSIKGQGIKFVYISTDAVYGNVNGKSLHEEDPVTPVNYYGKTKYLGEQEALKADKPLVLRTNIFGWNIQDKFSLAEWIIHELSCKREIQGFNDVYFSSIYTFDLSHILDRAMRQDLQGIYNCGSRTSMSKYDFALRIADYFHLDKRLIKNSTIDEFCLKAKRTRNLAMDVTKIEQALGIQAPTIEESMKRFYEDYEKGVPQKIKSKVYPVLDYIPYGCQSITEDDIQAVVETLRSSNLAQGPKINEFERELCKIVNVDYAVAVNSGTSALHIACLAAGIGPGDEVITSSNSFVASANCAVYCKGKPVFADIDPRTYNISPEEIEKKITDRTKVVIPVHFAGQSCDMEAIKEVVSRSEKKYSHKIYIVEDAAHALGSEYKGTKVGSCRYSDMTVMSFHPVKHITTGEGGMVLTVDEQLCSKLRGYRSHGITSTPEEFFYKDQAYASSQSANIWYYEQQQIGYNYRITDIQCALGISQLRKLPFFVRRRREAVARYNKAFLNKEFITTPYGSPDGLPNWHLYVLSIDFQAANIERNVFMRGLREKGIYTQVHYIPIHTQPFYQKNFGYKWGDYPVTEKYYQRCLSIPLFPAMTEENIEEVIRIILKDLYAG